MIRNKKINIKRYNLSFLIKPLAMLSALSPLFYVLKIYNVQNTGYIYLYTIFSVLLESVWTNCKNPHKKINLFFIIIILMTLYIAVYDDFVIFLAEKCENSGVKFGVLNSIFNTFGLTDFENLIYYTSYGGAKYINGNIVTGAIDIFIEKHNSDAVHTFLGGELLTIFILPGIVLSFKKNKKEALIITAFAMLTGDFTVYLFMLLFVYTPYYFIFLLFNFICFLIANTAEMNYGFAVHSSFFELLFYNKNLVYIFAVGIFMCAVAYYFSRLVTEKKKWYNFHGD